MLYAIPFLLVPALILLLAHRVGWARRVGPVLLCYLAGLFVGNSGLLPTAAAPAQTLVTELAVVLALPMLLFTLDVRSWRRAAGRAILSMLLAVTAVVTMAVVLFMLFFDAGVERPHELAGLTVAVYTGGTPNLAGIKAGLGVDDARYVLFHSFDVIAGGLYLLFMLTLARPLFRRLLPAARCTGGAAGAQAAADNDEDYRPLLRRSAWPSLLKALALSGLIVAAAVGLSQLLASDNQTAAIIILLTTLAILASLFGPIRRLPHAYKFGMYFIYVFSFAVASQARFSGFDDVDFTPLLFLLGAVAGSLALHALLCRLLRVDADTFMVTSVAAICSPPFVPMIAKTLGNPGALLSGVAAGILGYALGNYLGVSLGLLLAAYAP